MHSACTKRSHHLCLLLLLVFAAPIAAFAVPWGAGQNSHFAAKHYADEHTTQKGVFPRLTWLRDTVIQKLFGLPPTSAKPAHESHGLATRPTSSQLPATLLAKYGGDVVLRFNLSTAAEETALAEAADTLFLDVWEFTNNWADLRLREDDVRT